MNVEEFYEWERASRDVIDVKRCYVDIAGDLASGILLSQIIYWFLPDREGKLKLRIQREGEFWLAKNRTEWWDECRISKKQFDRAITVLRDKGLVTTKRFRFRGSPTVHIRLNVSVVVQGVNSILTKGENPIRPNGNMELDERVKSLHTEITTETTTIDNIKDIWNDVLEHLKDQISPSNFKTWLASTAPTSFDGTLFVVSAKSEFAANHLNKNMRSMIEGVLTGIVGGQVKFKCVHHESDESPPVAG